MASLCGVFLVVVLFVTYSMGTGMIRRKFPKVVVEGPCQSQGLDYSCPGAWYYDKSHYLTCPACKEIGQLADRNDRFRSLWWPVVEP